MKLNILILTAAATFGLAAQEFKNGLTAQVPFAFEVTGKPMPAGTYSLLRNHGQPYVMVRHAATGKTFLFDYRGTNVRLDKSALEFVRSGDRSVLARVVEPGTQNKIELPKGRAGKELVTAGMARVAVTVAE